MKAFIILLFSLSLTSCVTVLERKDIQFCEKVCENSGGALEVGKKFWSGGICCRCSNGLVAE